MPSPLVLVRQRQVADGPHRGPGVDDRPRVAADHEVLPVGPERAVGGDRDRVGDRAQLVRAVRVQAPGRRVEDAAEDLLGHDVEPAGARVGQQRLRVARPVGVHEVVGGVGAAALTPPDRDAGDRDRAAGSAVVADVPDPDLARAGGCQRLHVHRGLGEPRDAHGPARLRAVQGDGEDPAGVAGVVDGRQQPAPHDQARGFHDLRVGEGRHDLTAVGGQGRGDSPGQERQGDQHREQSAHAPPDPWPAPASSSANRGRSCQVATSSSYSETTEPPRTGEPVRTARSMVLRGVCSEPTNSTTSTR